MSQTKAPRRSRLHDPTPSFPSTLLIALIAVLMAAGGCEEEKKRKPYKSAKSRKVKRESIEEKEKAEKVDPIDEAWNTAPVEGMAKLRIAMRGPDGMIKGRPSFMAPQFELIAVELLEKLHEDGFRATDRKRSAKFNPNEHGRYVWELKPGSWKVYVTPLGDLLQPWISEPLTLKEGESRSIEVKLLPTKAAKKKW